MRTLPTGCVDLVICSPPYEDARTYGIGYKLRGQKWAEWAADRFCECLRVSSGLVAWVVGHGSRGCRKWSAAPALLIAELVRRGVHLRNPAFFHRVGIPGSGQTDWLRADVEWIVCATRTGKRLAWSDNTAMGHAPKWGPGGEMSHRLSDGSRRNQWGAGAKSANTRRPNGKRQAPGRPSHILLPMSLIPWGKRPTEAGVYPNGTPKPVAFKRLGRGNPKGSPAFRAPPGHHPDGTRKENRRGPVPVIANPGNLIRCVVGGNQMGSKLAHKNEAPFPEALAEFWIRSFCRPGGTVLDPFSGSGTAPAVAIRLGRHAVAIDCRRSQCRLTGRRILEVLGSEKRKGRKVRPRGLSHSVSKR